MSEIQLPYTRGNFCRSVGRQTNPVTYARAQESILSGQEAIDLVWSILTQPGLVAIDFETWPTAPAFHGEQAAAAAPRGQKGAARARAEKAAERDGRAHSRVPCILSLAHENGAEAVVRLADPAHDLPAMFEGRAATLTAHNSQFETEVLLNHGVAVDVDCTLLMAKALYLTAVDEDEPQPVSFGLADLVGRELGRQRNDKSVRNRDWREPVDDLEVGYCRRDARDALELAQLYRARLGEEGLLEGYEVIARAILPTAAINLVGMEFDAGAHAALVERLSTEADQLERELDRICDGAITNHSSSAQIAAWVMDHVLDGDDPDERLAGFCARLRARAGVSWRRTAKTGVLAITKSAKRRMAEALAEPFPVVADYLVAHVRRTTHTKLLGTFGESLAHWVDGDGRLRGQLKMGGTVTLRHSASRPNVQQMPREKEYRGLFRSPPERVLGVCDFSQIELRLAAIIAPDEALLAVYREGRDVHLDVANSIGMERSSQSKGVSFAMIYGAGVAGVAEASGLSLERAAEVVEAFLTAYPGLRAYRERAPQQAEHLGAIPIRPSRRVHYDPVLSKATQAINYSVQGAAASVQMRALRRVYDALAARPELDARLVGAIHDEIILEMPADERAAAAAELLQAEMRLALIEIFPESEAMGAAELAKTVICRRSWAEKKP